MRKFSDNIPLELQEEIIKRVPVKSLLRFRSVSKEWKSVIDSPNFADDYCLRHSQPHRLLIRYRPFEQYNYVLVDDDDDDDTFQQHQIPNTTLINLLFSRIVGCSHGLVCFYGPDYRDKSYMSVIWNPWIRKYVDVPVPNVLFNPYGTIIGFGVSPQTKDPMLVKINNFLSPTADTSVQIPWRVEVFTLSSGTWKTPSCSGNSLPCRNSIMFRWSPVALDGVLYWLAFEWIEVDGGLRHHNLIMSFDLSSEGFQEVCLPDNLACRKNYELSISKRMESVVVLEFDETGTFYRVWVMGQGVTKSFTKLLNIMPMGQGVTKSFTNLLNIMPQVSRICFVYGFMKNGEPIVDYGFDSLFAYDHSSERIKDLGIVGNRFTFSVEP